MSTYNKDIIIIGNIIDKDCTELVDCVFKKSMFIGYLNKLRSNFRHLQPHVLINLFKVYIVVHFTGRSYGNLTPLELINVANHGT